MKRRDFFKAVGGIVTALGISEFDWFGLSDRYGSALAQATPRKLALLIGINEYNNIEHLDGCITDVELQKELLIHRFGFKANDVLTLSNQQATRQQIEAAFLEHLTQASPGDVVVFHFSGYGRRIELSEQTNRLETGDQEDSLLRTHNSLVVSDSQANAVDDLLEETLWSMLRSLSTQNITTILDTSFYTPRTIASASKLRIRSCPQVNTSDFPQLPATTLIPGLVMTAAGTNQPAIETQWGGFSAGLFTYALTQSLWEATPATTVQLSLSKASGVVEQVVGKEQQPQLSGQKSQAQLYHFMPDTNMSADGVVIAVEDDGVAQLWLAGLEPSVLQYYGVNSRLSVTPLVSSGLAQTESTADKVTTTYLQVRSRNGLTAKAQIIADASTTLQVGQLIQEAVRVLPRNINLNIALDPGLERIERVDATSAFATAPYVSLVTSEPADYLFGRVRETTATRYGLLTLAQELIPNSAGEAGEAVKVAVQRLAPKLRTLLAGKLWRLTTNASSSRVAVEATLEALNANQQTVIQHATLGTQPNKINSEITSAASIPTLPTGSRIQYKIYNASDRPIYLLLCGLDSNKNAIALYPEKNATDSPDSAPELQNLSVAPGETLTLPRRGVDVEWVLHGPSALWEMQLILSSRPFTQTFAALSAAHDLRREEYINVLSNPLEIAQAVLQDLHNASAIATETVGAAPDVYTLDVNAWASFNFLYQVV